MTSLIQVILFTIWLIWLRLLAAPEVAVMWLRLLAAPEVVADLAAGAAGARHLEPGEPLAVRARHLQAVQVLQVLVHASVTTGLVLGDIGERRLRLDALQAVLLIVAGARSEVEVADQVARATVHVLTVQVVLFLVMSQLAGSRLAKCSRLLAIVGLHAVVLVPHVVAATATADDLEASHGLASAALQVLAIEILDLLSPQESAAGLLCLPRSKGRAVVFWDVVSELRGGHLWDLAHSAVGRRGALEHALHVLALGVSLLVLVVVLVGSLPGLVVCGTHTAQALLNGGLLGLLGNVQSVSGSLLGALGLLESLFGALEGLLGRCVRRIAEEEATLALLEGGEGLGRNGHWSILSIGERLLSVGESRVGRLEGVLGRINGGLALLVALGARVERVENLLLGRHCVLDLLDGRGSEVGASTLVLA